LPKSLLDFSISKSQNIAAQHDKLSCRDLQNFTTENREIVSAQKAVTDNPQNCSSANTEAEEYLVTLRRDSTPRPVSAFKLEKPQKLSV
jgi:hypothetical protein